MNEKKKYFKNKIKGVECMIWDSEFKREKTLMVREVARREYDNLKAKKEAVAEQIKAQETKKTMEDGDIARLKDQIVLFDRDIANFENKMKQLDLEVYGGKPTSDNPDGIQGINDQIDALQELKGMLKNYIKGL